jgi:hypothetical protein
MLKIQLSYKTFSYIKKKRGLYLLIPFQHHNSHIYQCLIEEIKRLKTFTNWTPFVLRLKNFYHSHVIMQALNTNSS